MCKLLYFSTTENPYWRDKGNTPTALQTAYSVHSQTKHHINHKSYIWGGKKVQKRKESNVLTTISASNPVPECKSIIRINPKLFYKLHSRLCEFCLINLYKWFSFTNKLTIKITWKGMSCLKVQKTRVHGYRMNCMQGTNN